MSTALNGRTSSSLESHAIAPTVIPASRRMYWSVRRELWENRSIYIAPFAAAVLILIGFVISMVHLPDRMRAATSAVQQQELIQQPYDIAAMLIMGATFIVSIFYCLDALYGERRDRSILFWKSLPVSDLMTVLSKASIPLVVLPLLTFATTVVTQSVMLLINSAVLMANGLSATILWTQLPLFPMWLMVLNHLLAGHSLWYAPIYGWLLLVSAWARRAPILWAVLPLLAIVAFEKVAFHTSYFSALLAGRFGGGTSNVESDANNMTMHLSTQRALAEFVTSPGLWIGLALTALFLAAAVRLRHSREPI